MNPDNIAKHWTDQAITEGTSHSASWSDYYAIQLENNEISRRLRTGWRIIDIGCANGFSTLRYAADHDISIKGIDYIPEMIHAAQSLLAERAHSLRGSVSFTVGNILSLKEPDEAYDAAIVTRVIINLGNRDAQVAALRECARVLKRGAILLLSEATIEGWRRLNSFRAEWNLPEIPQPPFNLYVDNQLIEQATQGLFSIEEAVNFSSTYYVTTRVIKPLLALASLDINVANPNMEWNRFSSMLPAVGDYGVQKLFVLRRL